MQAQSTSLKKAVISGLWIFPALPVWAQELNYGFGDSTSQTSFGLGWMLFGGFTFLVVVGLLAYFSEDIIGRSRR